MGLDKGVVAVTEFDFVSFFTWTGLERRGNDAIVSRLINWRWLAAFVPPVQPLANDSLVGRFSLISFFC